MTGRSSGLKEDQGGTEKDRQELEEKSFVTLTKERPSLEEDNVLINKFREQNPFEEGDEAEVDRWKAGRESKMPSSSSYAIITASFGW